MSTVMREGPTPLPDLGDPSSARVLLRDGTVASLRAPTRGDQAALQQFFDQLSRESRYRRFLSFGTVSTALVDALCAAENPARSVTLAVWRHLDEHEQPIAVASYNATNEDHAEVAFAVDDEFQGLGLGTTLLERLAAIAVQHGFHWFQAVTATDNHGMLDVFRDSGFELRSQSSQGLVDVRLDLAPTEGGVAAMERRHRQTTLASMRPVLEPTSVAVIGVSRERSGFGRRIFDNVLAGGYRGRLYPVNARATAIAGHPCLQSARDLPEPVDLAIIAVPSPAVLGVVEDCAAAHVRSVVIISAGFAESGADGRARQDAVLEAARGHGMRIVGPNCMGVLSTHPDVSLNATFADRQPPPGRIALASQSGGLGLTILQLASDRHVGISTFISLGNKADVSGNDVLQYGESDPRTSVILLYVESFGNPRRFAQLARRISRHKPIVVVKAGRSHAGGRAAGSHTAGLASNDATVAALFEQSGIIRAETIGEMFDVATCLDLQPLPPGERVAIVTNAGGPGILVADACEAAGLTVVEFSPATQERLRAQLSPEASLGNPLDLVASAGPGDFRHAVGVALASTEVDSVIVMYTAVDQERSAAVLDGIAAGVVAGRAGGGAGKPVLACLMALGKEPAPIPAGGAELVPSYAFPENAARALAKARAYARGRAEPPGLYWSFDEIHATEARTLCQAVLDARGETWLTSEERNRVLNAFGLPMAAGAVAHNEDEAAAIAAILGFPVVLKLIAPEILHKSDADVVRVNLATEKAVRTAFSEIANRAVGLVGGISRTSGSIGVLIQPMFDGVETLVGLTEDHSFGPLVAFGLGGVAVEVLQDVAFRIAPLTDRDADTLMRSVRGYQLLQGYRGRPACDLEALREVLLRVSLVGREIPEIAELDLNPVIALPEGHGCRIVDARVRVARPAHRR